MTVTNIIKSHLLDIILFSFFRRTECIKTGCTPLSKEFNMDLFRAKFQLIHNIRLIGLTATKKT